MYKYLFYLLLLYPYLGTIKGVPYFKSEEGRGLMMSVDVVNKLS